MHKAISSDELSKLPKQPGVYLFRDSNEEIVYIGKAKSLRRRVRSYFQNTKHSLKTEKMLRRVSGLETMVVESEAEALILEANLIKKWQPYFNVHMRDDKTYPYIMVTVGEDFPRVIVTRTVRNDGSRYFGPFTSVGQMRNSLSLIRKLYTVRSCSYRLPSETPQRPCLDYHIGLCLAPCVGNQEQSSYRSMIEEVLQILAGNTSQAQKRVVSLMKRAVEDLKFEEAAKFRDILIGLEALVYKQRVERLKGDNLDAVGFARLDSEAVVVVMQIRHGVLISRKVRRLERLADATDEIVIEKFISRYYLEKNPQEPLNIPEQVLVPCAPINLILVEQALQSVSSGPVKLIVPIKGAKKRLINLAIDNALHLIETDTSQEQYLDTGHDVLLESVRDKLKLKILPRFMACVDISHHQGKEVVGSVVVFQDGKADKSEYRKMKVKGDNGNDDFRAMGQVVRRYLTRRLKDNKHLPDLFVLDGGKGQLSTVEKELKKLDLSDLQLVAIAKRDEELFLPGKGHPLTLDKKEPALKLLQRIRDEAHRFALNYSKKLRGKKLIHSQLADIPGVGPERQVALLRHFGSMRAIKEAKPVDIATVSGFSGTLANRVYTYLNSFK